MEVLNISIDDNEADTSHDELDEDPIFKDYFLSQPFRKKYIHREGISSHGVFREWERPPVEPGTILYNQSPNEPQPEVLRFLFLDSVSTLSNVKHRVIASKLLDETQRAPLHTVIRLFGVVQVPTYSIVGEEGENESESGFSSTEKNYTASICCNVHGFLPYFYALPILQFFEDNNFEEIKEKLLTTLNEKVCEEILNDFSLVELHEFLEGGHPPVVEIEGVQLDKVENSIFHFSPSRSRRKNSLVLKVFVALPMFISATTRVLKKFIDPCEFETYETIISNNIRFLTDQNLPGCTWLELEAGKYFERTNVEGLERESHCQIEVDVHYKDIVKSEDQSKEIPPLRVLSFDLETRVVTSKKTEENKDTHGQIIQIGAVLSTYGAPDNPIIGKAAFVLGTCDALPDAKVIQFYDKSKPNNCAMENLLESEALMLVSFRDFVIQMDPDIITGYNIKNFDLPRLISRAEIFYHQYEDVKRLPFLGRLKKVHASVREVLNDNKKMYEYDKQIVNVQGRIVMDMYPLLRRHTTGNGNGGLKLKMVAKKYLKSGEEKDDVKYTEINDLQNGTSATRGRLAKYCVQDSYLPIRLMAIQMPDRNSVKQNFVEYYFENSRLGGTIMRYLVNKSRDYNKYFKQVRVQKSNGQVKYHPDSPNAKNLVKNSPSKVTVKQMPAVKPRKCGRMLFTDDDDV